MRKFYSLVLMATALLIGTNSWGQSSTVQLVNHTHPTASGGYATLQDAIDAVAPGDTATITLLEEQNLTASIVIPNAVGESAQTFAARGKVVGRQPQRICLNLNGNNIEGDGALNQCCIALLKGVLHITGEGEINKRGSDKGSFSGWTRAAIAVSGAPGNKNDDNKDYSKDGWWSTLIIDENVKVTAPDNFKSVGLAIMDIGGYIGNSFYSNQNTPAFIGVRQQSTKTNPTTDADDKLGYSCYNAFNALTHTTLPDANDIMWSRANSITYQNDGITVKSNTDLQSCSFGVRVVVKGEIYGMNRGIFVFGPINQHPESFPTEGTHKETRTRYTIGNEHPYYYEHYFPWITLASTARVHCKASGTNDEEAGGIYAAGWAVWDISGEIYGQNGMYIKGGDIKLNDANVYSQDATYGNDGWRNGKVAGNGIFITTDEGYAGDMSVEVNGDSRIAGNGGVAIVEVVANVATTPDVNSVTINGGTIEGGSTGAIMVTEPTGDKTVAYGGTSITGITTKGGTESSVAATGTYVTEVIIDPATNKSTIVISDLGAGNSVETVTENLTETEKEYVKWTGTADQYILTDMTLEYLEMNPSPAVAQKIYVGDDTHQATLTVDRVVMGSLAQIIVAPGSKLIITGTDGIVAPKVENILLKSSESAQAIFLFNPGVSSNRHPNATVQLTSKGYHATGKYIYQRFGVPTYTIKPEEGAVYRGGENVNRVTFDSPSAFYYVDYAQENDPWHVMANSDIFVPFQCYEVTCGATAPGTVYTFTCPLMGNTSYTLPIYSEWNYYANSYMAPIDIKEMLADLSSDSKVEGTIYVYRSSDNWWDDINMMNFMGLFGEPTAAQTEIDPMQAFIFRSQEGTQDAVVNYEEHIYNPIVNPSAPAPARTRDNNVGTVKIEIVAADGSKDALYLVEDNQFSAEYDNGYDAAKYMNGESFNLFASINDKHMSKVATDNLEGTTISMTTKDQTSFTMTLSYVNGMNYAVRDNLTGTEIEMVEGATYMFSTAANANIEGRFDIVPIKKVPTAIENIEATAASKGIYTITGQFVGNDYHSLPNGIYVIDGKKIVK